MKLADMKRTTAEKKADKDRYAEPMGSEEYPHTLHIEFDNHGLKKLGIDDMPKPGDEYHGEFHGRVTEASENANEGDNEPRRRVRMVMHKIGVEPKGDAKADKASDDVRKAMSDSKK